MESRTYSQRDVDVIVGDRVLTDVEGDIEVSAENPHITAQQDAEGNVTWTVYKNAILNVKFPCRYGSMDHATLSELANADLSDGSGGFTFSIRDNRGETLLNALDGHVVGFPNLKFGAKESQPVEWELKVGPATWKIGKGGT